MENTRRPGLDLTPSIADIFFIAILFFLMFFSESELLEDGDTGYHIRAGEYIIETLSIPRTDIFSFHTPPFPWTAHEWLSEVVMALIHNALGLTGIVAFFAFLLALTTYLLFRVLRRHRGGILSATLITTLAFSSGRIHWLARPHVFSLLFMVLCHFVLESWHRGRENRLYLLPLLMLLWVNLHGGFVGGFILMGAYLLGALTAWLFADGEGKQAAGGRLLQLGLALAASLAACLINPQGYRILLFPFNLVSNEYLMDNVSEFLSPNFHEASPFKYLLLLLVGIFAVSRKRIETTELLLTLVFINMALYSARYIPLFALVAAPILTRHALAARPLLPKRAASFLRRRSENLARLDARGTPFLWPALALCLVGWAVWTGKVEASFNPKKKPVAAMEFLTREKITGNMFNNDEFGDYLIYRSYPKYRVFFDGRSDMYGTELMKEYWKVVNFEPGWEAVLEKYRVSWIFYPTDSNFSRYLLRDRGWVLVYSDPVASIFLKELPQHRELIEKYRGTRLALPVEASHADLTEKSEKG